MDSFFMIFDGIAICFGIYIIFTFVKLKIAGRLFPNALLIPKDQKVNDCQDAQAYIRYIGPRLLILGISVMLYGIGSVILDLVTFEGIGIVHLSMTVVALAFLFWFGYCNRKAFQLYW